MSETEHTQENIAYIRTHVDKVEQLTRFAIASNPKAAEFIDSYLRERKGAPKVYLCLAEKPLNLDELMALTQQSRPTVSRICSHLANHGIIRKIRDPDKPHSFKYCWTDLENMLGVSKIARQIAKES